MVGSLAICHFSCLRGTSRITLLRGLHHEQFYLEMLMNAEVSLETVLMARPTQMLFFRTGPSASSFHTNSRVTKMGSFSFLRSSNGK